ncbi:LysR family transcriptional regulator [Sphingobium mellinum]|uniref:LysR substrate-binding domain-containing protein n=1 Tax=Sphingobium mellinum TaxID=1387166 RepID=UPI0030EE0BD0
MPKSSLRQLDIFAQMVADGSIARCARNLGIAVDDVARDLASLELRLGYRLFEDLSDGARLTGAGRRTAQAMTLLSQDHLESWQAPEIEGAEPPLAPAPPPEPARHSIVLAAPAPVFGHFQEALAAFESVNEDIAITLDLTIHLADEAASALRQGKIDIAYFYALGEPDGFASRYGWSEPINLYVGVDHPLARRDSVSLAELAVTPMLAMEPRNALRRIVEEALARQGIVTGSPVLETDNMFDILTILREGAGCFAAFGPLARDLGRMPGIQRLALERALPSVEVRQAMRQGTADQSPAAALAEYLFL